MVERIALIKLKPEHANAEERARIVERALGELAAIPGVASLTAGTPADAASEASWDVIVTARCASLADLESYRSHPAHRRFVDEFLVPRSDVRKAWNFVVGGGA
ncbi:MAG TPA: Dabb family protein [Candidatus Binatia bacterium]|nr:Dabb family protein [Candidatus Binatia bacterium]